MSFPRYPKYKDSGVEWLTQVPEHWTPKKLGAISSLKGRLGWQGLKADEYRDEGPYVVSSAHFDNHKIQWDECPRVSQERYHTDGNIQLAANDVLLMKDGAAMGKLAFIDRLPGPACLNSHLLLFRPVKIDGVETYSPRFAFYFMQTGYFQEHIKVNGTGATFLGISQEAIGRYQIDLPPLSEQTSIAAFLDCETAKIDALVAEQQRLMELLKEKRQAVISHAVTKGLNPNAPMKPSGVGWLGEIPAHWIVTPLKWLTDPERPIMYGIVLPGPDVGEGVPILKGGNVKPSRMNLQSMARTTPEIEAPFARARLKQGDLVYAIRGTIGDCEPVPAELAKSNITQDVARVAIANGICASWARWALLASAIRDDLACGSLGAAVRGVNIFDLKRANIPTPPHREQVAIAAFIDRETLRLEELTVEAQRAIDLLQERRTALISAAVTGQIDVRNSVASDQAKRVTSASA